MIAGHIERAATRLMRAWATSVACAPVRDLIERDDLTAAYAVQTRVTAARRVGGAQITGRKIGLTSPAVQQQLGVDRPDFGVLFDDMAYADGAEVPFSRFLQPRVEAEVAFVLGADLADGPLDVAHVRGAVAYAVAALEICDSRIERWDITFADTVADNASAGAYVLGSVYRSLAEFEPVDVSMSMDIDGVTVSRGTGAACLGDPLNALAWLATTAREFGDPLRAGQVVLSGALGPMVPVAAGARVTAALGALGSVRASFAER